MPTPSNYVYHNEGTVYQHITTYAEPAPQPPPNYTHGTRILRGTTLAFGIYLLAFLGYGLYVMWVREYSPTMGVPAYDHLRMDVFCRAVVVVLGIAFYCRANFAIFNSSTPTKLH